MAKLEAPAIADSDVEAAQQFLDARYSIVGLCYYRHTAQFPETPEQLMAAYLNWYLLSVEAKK